MNKNIKNCFDIGRKGVIELLPLLNTKAFQGRFVITDKGNVSELLQKTVGDIIFNCANQETWSIEVKTEEENKYGNFYLETWSNLSRLTPGWMVTMKADFLWYYFQDIKILYSIQLPKLQSWAFMDRKRIYAFPEKMQKKTVQLNDTWGRCVPIKIIEKEVGFKVYNAITTEQIVDNKNKLGQKGLF